MPDINTRQVPATRPTIAGPASVAVDQVMAQLAPFAKFDLKTSYHGEPRGKSIVDAWKHKDAGGIAAWQNAGAMGPVFRFTNELNMGAGGDYMGRAISQNMDAAIWLRALVREGVIAQPSQEWRAAIEVASLTLDVGDDGAGRTGFMYVLSGVDGYPSNSPAASVKMPTGIQSRAGMLVGGSGQGMHVEKLFGGPSVATTFASNLADEGHGGQTAKTLSARAKDPAMTAKEIDLVKSGKLVDTRAGRDAFAEALLVTKLADRSRGALFSAYLAAGGGDAGLDAVLDHKDWDRVVMGSFVAQRNVRKD
jgi:hypothetical protein